MKLKATRQINEKQIKFLKMEAQAYPNRRYLCKYFNNIHFVAELFFCEQTGVLLVEEPLSKIVFTIEDISEIAEIR